MYFLDIVFKENLKIGICKKGTSDGQPDRPTFLLFSYYIKYKIYIYDYCIE